MVRKPHIAKRFQRSGSSDGKARLGGFGRNAAKNAGSQGTASGFASTGTGKAAGSGFSSENGAAGTAVASATAIDADSDSSESRFRAFLRRNRNNLILAAIFVLGVLIFCYPSFSNWWNSFHQSRALMDYADNVSDMDTAQYQALLDAAHAYNEKLAQTGQNWSMTDADKAEYNSLLNIDGTGIMGYIQIPKINVELPLYHGTDDAVLQTSIGHLAGTSLPVGGPSTHSVLSGHRGLPSARLFTDLDQLEEGDTFTLTILNETLTYEVDQIRIVEPTDLSDLQIEPGQDLCTLVTCTPYGINTQRLLVRGHRVANAMGDAEVTADAFQIRTSYIAAFIAVPVVLLLFIYVLVSTDRRHRKHDAVGSWLNAEGLSKPRIPMDEDELRSQRMRRTVRRLRDWGSFGDKPHVGDDK